MLNLKTMVFGKHNRNNSPWISRVTRICLFFNQITTSFRDILIYPILDIRYSISNATLLILIMYYGYEWITFWVKF